jgi:hypothetical protein
MPEYTPEKVAEEIANAQKAVWAEIHGQAATRTYTVAEVKRLIYSLDNAFSTATTAIQAVSAERDELRAVIEATEDFVTAHYLDTQMGEKVRQLLSRIPEHPKED